MSKLREYSDDEEQQRLRNDFRARRMLELFKELPENRKEALMETLQKQVYSPEEVSKILGKSLETVRRWLRDGTLAGTKLGRSWIVSNAEIERILRNKN
jgi:excisionase family DNA binding protein